MRFEGVRNEGWGVYGMRVGVYGMRVGGCTE